MGKSFPKEWRLTKPKEYKEVFGNAKAIRGRQLTLLYIPNDFGHPRLGMALSNKHSGNVVRRNRFKRWLREFLRQQLRDIGGLDIVIVSKPGLAECSRKQIFDALDFFKRRLLKHVTS